jgi:cytochrome oxidase Cu insertion factor (SCO1/SenC/PrrC family)
LAERLASSDPERAKALYRELVANYAELDAGWGGTFGAVAERALYELEHLQVGMVAPEFEASDENGVKFKVSDYRGKVVVLDFWGFW